MKDSLDEDMMSGLHDLIEYYDKPLVIAIGFADHSLVLANDKMIERSFYDKQAVLVFMTTGLVDYLSSDIPFDEGGLGEM